MADLTVCTWLWGSTYGADYVSKLVAGVRRHLQQDHEFLLVCDSEGTAASVANVPGVRVAVHPSELYAVKGCFVRLEMFSPQWQARHGITGRLVCIDLDTVITGRLDPLFDRPEPFCILQGGNVNSCGFNGSLQMLRAGAHPEVWSDFTLDKAQSVPFYLFPDDQGWLWHKLRKAVGWKVGSEHGCYVFMKPGWPRPSDALPQGARYVTFAGWRDPSKFMHLDWVKEHWR